MQFSDFCPLFDHRYTEPRNVMSRPPFIPDDGNPLPERCLMSFMGDPLESYVLQHSCERIATYHSETREFPLFRAHSSNGDICLVQAPVGAPAAAILADLLIFSGVKYLVACGGCGVLQHLSSGMILLPTSALRDEGTSYHYVGPSRSILLDAETVESASRTLSESEVPFKTCKTWTTDGFFRETSTLVELRKSEGCETVDMECAALAAVAQAYGIPFAEILYSGDGLYDPKYHYARNWIFDSEARAVAFLMAFRVVEQLGFVRPFIKQ